MKKNNKKNKIFQRGIGQGIAAGAAVIFALLFILSVLIEKEAVGGEAAVFCTYIICVAGGLVGGILASDSKFENSMICAAVFAGVKVLLTALNEASKIESAENVIIFLSLVIAPICGGLIATRKKTKKRR